MNIYMQLLRRSWIVGLSMVLATYLLFCLTASADAQSYTPPTHITVEMYAFDPESQVVFGLCVSSTDPTQRDGRRGCTAFPDNPNLRYPFATNPATVRLDGTTPEDRYLLDVVPQEMSPSTHLLPALQAQAIAARTYAFWHVRTEAETPGAINNLEDYQVFIPRTYDRLSAAEQQLVDAAVLQNRYYMSYKEGYSVNIYGQNINLTDQDPIFAEFSADVRERTVANPTFSYLQSVADPISSHPQVPVLDGHGHGLSQNGAGRWARGSESYRCDPSPAPCEPAPTPPVQAWSVRWEDAFQILTHYYTGIHLRDANNGNQIVTPVDRWAPLQITANGRPLGAVCAGTRLLQLTVWFQNTSTRPWLYGYPIVLREHPDTVGAMEQAALTQPTADLQPGDTFTATLSSTTIPTVAEAAHDFYLDMLDFQSGYWFSGQTPAWPRYRLTLPIVACAQAVYLPLVQGDASATTLSE